MAPPAPPRRTLDFFCAVVIVGLLAGFAGLATTEVLRFVEHVTYHYSFGTLLAGAGRIDEAVAPLREAVRLDPDSAEAQSNLGVVLGRAGQLAEAVTHYRKAIQIEPGDSLR